MMRATHKPFVDYSMLRKTSSPWLAFSRSLAPGLALLALGLTCLPASAQQAATPAQAAASAAAPARGMNSRRETSFPAIASAKWSGPRTAGGQPDVEGHWSNTIGNHGNFTDPQGGQPGQRAANAGAPVAPRVLGPRESRAPSRVSDPADGQVPFRPWARARQQEFLANFSNPTQPQYIEPLARCAPNGVPKSFMWHGFEVRQYPQYVLFLFDSGSRIIYLDGRPHLADNIKLWNADSRGHWEGNTLVVDVGNVNGKPLFGRTGEFFSENAHVSERYIFQADGKRFNYVATITDDSVFTRPFTVTIPVRRYTADDSQDGWNFQATKATHKGKDVILEREEQLCFENNGGFGLGGSAAK
jgi:hypothetical protein